MAVCAGAPAVGVALLVALATACTTGPKPTSTARLLVSSCDGVLCAGLRQSGAERVLVFENQGPVDATIRPQPDPAPWSKCCDILEPLPAQFVLRPGEARDVARFKPRRGWIVLGVPAFGYEFGSLQTIPDPAACYGFPFGGARARTLVQGPGGPTHTGVTTFAYDFEMPQGTPVLAAREGTVVQVVDGFEHGGMDPALRDKGNGVVVAHLDGTLATYGHLRAGIAVNAGQRVVRGAFLGESGNTGLSSGPHLHFHVGLLSGGVAEATIPVRFDADAPDGIVLEVGRTYGPGRPDGPRE